jgi:hypothetical protein
MVTVWSSLVLDCWSVHCGSLHWRCNMVCGLSASNVRYTNFVHRVQQHCMPADLDGGSRKPSSKRVMLDVYVLVVYHSHAIQILSHQLALPTLART